MKILVSATLKIKLNFSQLKHPEVDLTHCKRSPSIPAGDYLSTLGLSHSRWFRLAKLLVGSKCKQAFYSTTKIDLSLDRDF